MSVQLFLDVMLAHGFISLKIALRTSGKECEQTSPAKLAILFAENKQGIFLCVRKVPKKMIHLLNSVRE